MGKEKKKEKYLCPCFKISKKDIKKAIREGAASFQEIRQATNAGKGCGHCKCRVKDYTNKKLKKMK